MRPHPSHIFDMEEAQAIAARRDPCSSVDREIFRSYHPGFARSEYEIEEGHLHTPAKKSRDIEFFTEIRERYCGDETSLRFLLKSMIVD